MITGSNPCYTSMPPTYAIPEEDIVSSSHEASAASETHTNTFLYNLSLLKEKVHQVQSLASIFISPDHSQHHPESTAIAMPTMGTLIQEIIVTASSLIFTCQQMALGASSANNNTNVELQHQHVKLADHGPSTQPSCDISHVAQSGEESQQGLYSWYGDHNYNSCDTNDNNTRSTISGSNHNEEHRRDFSAKEETNGDSQKLSPRNYDIFELDAADLLAKYTHYCQVCGKGFKRDANLRMHMRAHGDEYKSNAALSNPMKNNNGPGYGDDGSTKLRKYSCPQEGCRWNKKHAKFQPLKSMICVKNHYKRSHCPKMYVCNRCNRKQFSLLSDLRTHEKHCGDLKWQCSCGTTFSRKDKLMGHVALFVGHTPLVSSLTAMRKAGENSGQIQLNDR